jgi:predicted RNA-binding protein YlxR (DUF448 family)
VGCRQVLEKRSLVRIVRTPEGVQIDPQGKRPGRGAYLHNQRSCWEQGLKGKLAHALKVALTAEERSRLAEYMKTFERNETATAGPPADE